MKSTILGLITLLLLVPLSFAATVVIPHDTEPRQVISPSSFVVRHSDINTRGLDTRTVVVPGKSDQLSILESLRQRKAARDAAGYNNYPVTEITYANPMPERDDRQGYGNGDYYWPMGGRNSNYGYDNYNFRGTYESCDIEYYSGPYTYGLGWPFSYRSSSSLFNRFGRDRYGYNNVNGNRCNQPGGYDYNMPGYGNQWYYFDNSTYYACDTNEEFKLHDCSYRNDGRSYYYYNPYAVDLYYDDLYDLDKVDVSDRFALINGRYVLCPERAFDHDECVFYYKGGKWYYDDPGNNDFTGIPNVEINSDLDRGQTNTTNQPNNQNTNQNNNTNNNSTNNTNQNNQNQNTGNIYGPSYVNYRAYVDQFPKFNFTNGQFVSCTSSCTYYKRDGIMFKIDQNRYAQG